MGTEAFWVPAVLAAVSAGGQYANQQQANSRQQAAEVADINNQQQLQQQALGKVNQLTRQVAQNTPAQIANQATGQYVQNLRRNEAGASQPNSQSSLAPVVGGSSQYNKDVNASQAAVNSFGNTEAGQMGQIDAGTRQRQNEGLAQSSLQSQLGLLGAQSATQGYVDQLRAAAAGQQNPWINMGSGLLSNYAGALSRQSGETSVTDPNTGAVMNVNTGFSFLPSNYGSSNQ